MKPRVSWTVTAEIAAPAPRSASRGCAPAPCAKGPLSSRTPPRWGCSPASRVAGRATRSPAPRPARAPPRPCAPRGCPQLRPARGEAWAPEPARRKPRRPPSWCLRPPPSTALSPRSSCSPRASCSCRGCAAPTNAPAPRAATRLGGAPARCSHPFRLRRPGARRRSRSRRRPAPARPPSATRRVHSLPPSFFSAPSQALEHPADGRLAHLHVGDTAQVLTPLGERRRRALLQVGLQQSLGLFACLRLGAGLLLRGERAPLVGHLGIAFDGGEAHGEGAESLALAHTAVEGLDYLLAQVFGVGIHELMVPLDQLHCNPLYAMELAHPKPKAKVTLGGRAYRPRQVRLLGGEWLPIYSKPW